jgi:serine protease Do
MSIRSIGAAALSLLLLCAAPTAGAPTKPAPRTKAARTAGPANLAPFEQLQDTIIQVSDRLKPTVVHVESIVRENGRRAEVTGSGIIADAQGHILTNHHIVDNAEKVTVTIPGQKKKLDAKVIGADVQTDIAVIQVNAGRPLPHPKFGDSNKVRVGEWVIAIGNPYGLDGTVSFGIVSAKGRNLDVPELINEFIQTDALIDRGSSGGPLVNLKGEVLGINSRGQGRGIGFTIPINTALDVMKHYIASGSVQRGWLGVSIQPFNRDLADYFHLSNTTGVIVNSVRDGSPAKKAGLKPGDILTKFSGKPIEAEEEKDLNQFQRLVAGAAIGKPVTLSVLRDGRPLEVSAIIAKQPKVEAKEEEARDLGINVKEITESLYLDNRLETRDGVFVSYVEGGTPAAEADIEPGDVVQELDGKPVHNLADFKKAMAFPKSTKRFLVKTQRGKDLKFLIVKLDHLKEAPNAPDASHSTGSKEKPL